LSFGGHVRKGEAGELVVYANSITRTETDAKGEETEREIPYMKGYTVFNAEQCDELPAHYTAKAEPPALTPMQRLEAADRFFAATGADIRHGGTRAYYAEGPDYVQMPPFETFRDAAKTLAAKVARQALAVFRPVNSFVPEHRGVTLGIARRAIATYCTARGMGGGIPPSSTCEDCPAPGHQGDDAGRPRARTLSEA
jgi:hypothetical protein